MLAAMSSRRGPAHGLVIFSQLAPEAVKGLALGGSVRAPHLARLLAEGCRLRSGRRTRDRSEHLFGLGLLASLRRRGFRTGAFGVTAGLAGTLRGYGRVASINEAATSDPPAYAGTLEARTVRATSEFCGEILARGGRFLAVVSLVSKRSPPLISEPFASFFGRSRPSPGCAPSGLISQMDHALGELVDGLDRLGCADDTLLVLACDSQATPWFWRWPRGMPGGRSLSWSKRAMAPQRTVGSLLCGLTGEDGLAEALCARDVAVLRGADPASSSAARRRPSSSR